MHDNDTTADGHAASYDGEQVAETADTGITALLAIMARLRDPAGGCPWDREQTFTSIAPYTLEEAYEVADAIERGDLAALCQELGDLLLQVVFHARIAEEQDAFTFDDVVHAIRDKLIRRHPHVFAGSEVRDAADQTHAWEEHKAQERAALALSTSRKTDTIGQALSTSRTSAARSVSPASTSRDVAAAVALERSTSGNPVSAPVSALADIPLNLPALTRAHKLQQRAARVGFDWPDAAGAAGKLAEEWAELRHELAIGGERARLADELGDVLFSCVNLARKLDFDAETVLRHANRKFERRFRVMEELAEPRTGQPFADLDLERQEALWVEAKAVVRGDEDDDGPAGGA